MFRFLKFLFATALIANAHFVSGQDEAANATDTKPEAPKADGANRIVSGTKIYDAQTIRDLYRDLKAQNEKRAEDLPPHLSSENMDLVELKPFQVEGDDLSNYKALVEKLQPKERPRLARLAEFDPKAAYDIQVTARNQDEFFGGRYDQARAAGAGSTADFNQTQLSDALGATMKKLRKIFGARDPEE